MELKGLPVKVSGMFYQLQFVDTDKLQEYMHNKGCLDYGVTDYNQSQMLVNSDKSKEQQRITVAHEYLHAFLNENSFYKETDDEHLVDSLAHGILSFVRDNPELLKFFQEK